MGNQNNGGVFAILALIFGIVGIVCSFIPFLNIVTLVLAVLAIVFGVMARGKVDDSKRGMATAGMILGIIAVVLSVIGICVCTCPACLVCADML